MRQTKQQTVVMKFGGTSVGSPETIMRMLAIVPSSTGVVGVVVSAFSHITNQLIESAQKASAQDKRYEEIINKIAKRHTDIIDTLITDKTLRNETLEQVSQMLSELENVLQGIYLIKELTPKTLDTIMSYGERLSALIIANCFINKGIAAEFVDARIFIKTDDNFGASRVDFEETAKSVKAYFRQSKNPIQIVTGFIGSTKNGETTTLGRGGSDYTASILGSILNVTKIEIWTDVNGVLTADPSKVPSAFSIKNLSYQEAMEMSHFGAKVIYPSTMIPAQRNAIPIVIRNTFQPEFKGTTVSTQSETAYHVKGISSIENITLIQIQGSGMQGTPGIVSRLFTTLALRKINIIFITQASSEYSICFAISPNQTKTACAAIEEEFKMDMQVGVVDPLIVEGNLSIIAVVGEQMRNTLGVAAKIFSSLAKEKINVSAIAQGSSERNISLIVESQKEAQALNAIHKVFFEEKPIKRIPLFITGTGLIGSTLLKQINALKLLVENEKIMLSVVGLANSKKMLFNPKGIDLSAWRKELDKGDSVNLEQFIKYIEEYSLTDSIFVDCTASDKIPGFYPELLKANISVVTPNKKANSGKMSLYSSIRDAAKKTSVFFMYETNVCAGLPIIKTIDDLNTTGDEIQKIEGVLSGTLSFIFNQYQGNKKFSDVLADAQKKGYTEPDPRDDLNGLDVGRKLLILAREIGLNLNLSDIIIENLVPTSCKKAQNIPDFYDCLKKEDAFFEKRKTQAQKKGTRLRYIASIDSKNQKFSCELKEVAQDSPFYSLSGSENIVIITTKRYNKTPMVIKGPGAGAEVTADGVLSDIIRIGKYYAFDGKKG